jgi:hypothetical protein
MEAYNLFQVLAISSFTGSHSGQQGFDPTEPVEAPPVPAE